MKNREKAKNFLRSMASRDPDVALAAQRAWAQQMNEPIRKGVFDKDNVGDIFEREVIEAGAQLTYPLDIIRPGEEDNYIAYTYQTQNRIPERRVEADEITVPTWRIANSIDWDLDIMKDARFDLVRRATEVYQLGFAKKINYDCWTLLLSAAVQRDLIVSAATQAGSPFTGRVHQGSATLGGEFTKELVSRMIITMLRGGGGNLVQTNLTDLYLSVEAMGDIRAWTSSDVDEFTRREVLKSNQLGMAELYGVALHPMVEFGDGQDYQSILEDLGASQPSGTVEWCVGLNLAADMSFVMPIRDELVTREDPALHRQWRGGIFGSLRSGAAVLDLRNVILGAT